MELYIDGHTVLIDEEDYNLVKDFKWRVVVKSKSYKVVRYKTTNKNRKTVVVWLHRLIMGVNGVDWKSSIVDHINGDALDNRKENLRIVTPSQSIINTKISKRNKSGVRGVDFKNGKYRARLSYNGVRLELGSFSSLEEAKKAYDAATQIYCKEYIRSKA